MKLTLGKKLFFYTSGTMVLLLLITFLVLDRNQSRQWEEHLRSQSLSFARFATPELLKLFRGTFPLRRGDKLQDVYDFLAFNRDLIRFTFFSTSGRVLFESPRFPDFVDINLPEDEELSDRLQTPRITARTLSVAGQGRILDLVTPAFGPTGEQILSVRYLISYDSVDARLREVRFHFLRIALITVFCSLLLAALVARRVTRPIKELTEGAKAIARAELQTRIETQSSDEIGALAKAFNEMTESLSDSRAELTRKNQALTETNEELRRIQEQLIRAERLAAIGQLAAGVSHEIDNPVGIILGYAELLLEDLDEGDSRRDDVRAIIEECKRCKRITGGLLGFARPTPARRESLSLNELVEETVASLRPQKLFKQVNFHIRQSSDLPCILGDADQLRQVLVNLLLNAAQAMDGCGDLTIDIYPEGSQGMIQVSDTGPGISEALRERIFEPFFSTKARGEGTGLGLSVCRKLVEEHGGTLSAGAAEGGGASFRLALPLTSIENCFDNRSTDH